MVEIVFTGWKVGMRGIPLIFLLKDRANVSLTQAKKIKENIVDGITVKLPLTDVKLAHQIVSEARELGVICELNSLG